jgi:GH24 family phage-related lysozyme (muramidase)
MPINKIAPTRRAKAALAGGASLIALTTTVFVVPWEAVRLRSYADVVGVWTICAGETKDVRPGQTATIEECDARLAKRLEEDFHKPLTRCFADFDRKPISWQAAALSLAYNAGVGAVCGSTGARLAREGKIRESCEAFTAFNRAGGRVLRGLVVRREMGDGTRIGEAELCVSGL